jgi:hypothetical protein
MSASLLEQIPALAIYLFSLIPPSTVSTFGLFNILLMQEFAQEEMQTST